MLELHELITNTMKERGLTQGQLAAAIGVSRQTLSSWLHGHCFPSIETIKRLRITDELWVMEFASSLLSIRIA